MPSCTCTSPDGTQSTTYEFESAPFGGEMDCDMAWRFGHGIMPILSISLWFSEAGSENGSVKRGWKNVEVALIGFPFLNHANVWRDKVEQTRVNGQGMGQQVDIWSPESKRRDCWCSWKTMGLTSIDIRGRRAAQNHYKPDSPFMGNRSELAWWMGLIHVWQVTPPVLWRWAYCKTAWGDAIFNGWRCGAIGRSYFQIQKAWESWPIKGQLAASTPSMTLMHLVHWGVFDISGLTWETIEGNSYENKVRNYHWIGFRDEFVYSPTADLSLLPNADGNFAQEGFNEMYRKFSEQKMAGIWRISLNVSKRVPYDLDAIVPSTIGIRPTMVAFVRDMM